MPVAYLGLGSNLGDRAANLWVAVHHLQPFAEARISRLSRIFESEPVGPVEQPCYLNTVVRVDVDLEPRDLLDRLKQIEAVMGRAPGERWGPRPIDLDILLYGSTEMDSVELTIPHRELWRRRFVLQPLVEIAEEVAVARRARTALLALPESPWVRLYSPFDPVSASH